MPTATTRPTLFCLPALGMSRLEFDPLRDALDEHFEDRRPRPARLRRNRVARRITVRDMAGRSPRGSASEVPRRWPPRGSQHGRQDRHARHPGGRSPVSSGRRASRLVRSRLSPPGRNPWRRSRRAGCSAGRPTAHLARRRRPRIRRRERRRARYPAGSTPRHGPPPPSPEPHRLARLAAAARTGWRRSAAGLPAPIVVGRRDGELGAPDQRLLNGHVYPRARPEKMEGAGHLLTLERPAEVADAILASAGTPGSAAGARRRGADDRLRPDGVAARAATWRGARLATTRLRAARAHGRRSSSCCERWPRGSCRSATPTTVDLAARIDARLAAGAGDGWRNADLPPDDEA